MIRIALPKGRNLVPVRAALAAAGVDVTGLEDGGRHLRLAIADDVEALLLKDWDLPLYVEHGIADLGVVGSDVLEEVGGDLLVPARLREGGSRMSLIARREGLPEAGEQVRLATKYPVTARRVLADRSWGADVLQLSGSIELAPLLDLAELALDIVQTGGTLRANRLVELEVVRRVAPCLIVNRGAYQQHRRRLNRFIDRLERAEVVE